MKELSSMKNNSFTVKIIDLFFADKDESSPDELNLFMVMEHMDIDMK